MTCTNSCVAWRGPSEINGQQIALVLTGLTRGSSNGKTGAVVQSYIVPANGMTASQNVRLGHDVSVCGSCPLRGDNGKGRRCYVSLATGLAVVMRALAAGTYLVGDATEIRAALRGKVLRMGTYGDPAAVPWIVWTQLVGAADAVVGYTHQWRHIGADLRGVCMASCDSEVDVRDAQKRGWRTFRVRRPTEELMLGEIACPAAAESGHRVDCAQCRLCGGASRVAKNIAIIDHSASGRAAVRRLSIVS